MSNPRRRKAIRARSRGRRPGSARPTQRTFDLASVGGAGGVGGAGMEAPRAAAVVSPSAGSAPVSVAPRSQHAQSGSAISDTHSATPQGRSRGADNGATRARHLSQHDHPRPTTPAAIGERRRLQRARQTHPNIANLPRSAPVVAIETALRRRAAAITHPLPRPETRPDTLPEPLEGSASAAEPEGQSRARSLRSLADAATARAGVTLFRRSEVAAAAAPTPAVTPAALPDVTPLPEPPATASAIRAAARARLARLAQLSQSSREAGLVRIASVSRQVSDSSTIAAAWTRRTVARHRARRKSAWSPLLTLALLLAIFVSLIPAPALAYLAYSNTMAMAKGAVSHLKSAEADFKLLANSPTNLTLINSAQSELQSAHNDFAQLQWRITLLSPASGLPDVGGKLAGVTKLLPLAVQGTQAGVLACDALKTLVTGLHDPLGTSGGLSSAQTSQVISDMDQIQALYGQMEPTLASLTPSDFALDPALWPTVSGLQARLPQVTQLMSDLDGMAHALPQLLGVGKPATYLVLVLDSSELRPTGGFIGNYGALTLSGGRLSSGFHISDITLIDSSTKFSNAPYQQVIPIPTKYNWLRSVFVDPNGASWSLRDSNLDPNYPTAAQYALSLYPRLLPDAQKNLKAQHSSLQLYNPARSGPFAGVITLNMGLFAQALAITGPLSVPQFHQTVTATNFVSKIHSYALGSNATGLDSQACGVTSCAKVFTSDVVQAFLTKVKANLSQYIGKLSKLLYDSLRTKDVEVYFTAPQAQRLLTDLKLDASVAAPASGDSVFEVDANIGANKDNYFLQYQMADQITLDAAGAATHRLNWSYRWPRDPATLKETFAAGSPDYAAYARVFTPPSAQLISQRNLVGFGSGAEFNRTVFHGSVSDGYGRTSSYALAWKIPGVVTQDNSGYHYHLVFQREAGITWPLAVTITAPKGATLLGAPVTSGLTAQDKVTVKGASVTIAGPLTMDAQVTINYSLPATRSTPLHTSSAYLTSRALSLRHWRTVVAARLNQSGVQTTSASSSISSKASSSAPTIASSHVRVRQKSVGSLGRGR